MGESLDYKIFKRNIKQKGDRIERIENLIRAGTPDINCCINGVECWIELKSPTEPKKSSTPLFGSNHRLTQDQMNWFVEQNNADGKGYILISTDKRWMLIQGKHGDIVNNSTVQELMSICCFYAIKPIKDKEIWKILRNVLASKQSHMHINLSV